MPNHTAYPDILNDGRINAGSNDTLGVLFRFRQFVFKYQRIEGDVSFNTPAVEELHQSRQISLSEIPSPHAGVKSFQAEIDCVGTVLHRCPGAIPVSRRSK